MEKKIYVVGGAVRYSSFLKDYTLVDKLEDANVVIFTGGEDVTPSYYGEEKHPTTYCNPTRDKREKEIFDKIDPEKQFVIGICRGSQFLCVMNGGKLVQNCTGHALSVTHPIIGNDKIIYQITSTHHQMQCPYNLDKEDYEILFKSDFPRSDRYEGISNELKYDLFNVGEPEVVLYHVKGKPKCLAIQGHPEMMSQEAPVCKMLRNLIDSLIG